mmetsp:Transcript_111137/g.325088  ORF Transcript_111137/g.325088 Transcript_111137/m.325088 type:complete len:418 (-) Transcript_111137:25-1278(-)
MLRTASYTIISALVIGSFLPVVSLRSRNGKVSDLESYTFQQFVKDFQRTYEQGTDEWTKREQIFNKRIAEVNEFNSLPDQTWKKGSSRFLDFTEDEQKRMLGYKGRGSRKARAADPAAASLRRHQELPRSFNAVAAMAEKKRAARLLNIVRDQGNCGSCWAVATATVLQAHVEISSGSSHRLSAQQLVSCVANPMECGGAGGCQGATVELALAYVTNHGLTTEHQTPYRAVTGSCQTTGHQHSQRILAQDLGHGSTQARLEEITRTGVHNVGDSDAAFALGMRAWEKLPENSMEHLMRAVVEHGPVAVSVGADGWNSYNAGVFDGCLRDNVINHAVTLLGYGVDAHRSAKYWTIQNSWGPGWGENGHMRLLRHDNDSYCGTDYQPEMGTACRGGPSSVRVCGMCGILYDSVVPHFTA